MRVRRYSRGLLRTIYNVNRVLLCYPMRLVGLCVAAAARSRCCRDDDDDDDATIDGLRVAVRGRRRRRHTADGRRRFLFFEDEPHTVTRTRSLTHSPVPVRSLLTLLALCPIKSRRHRPLVTTIRLPTTTNALASRSFTHSSAHYRSPSEIVSLPTTPSASRSRHLRRPHERPAHAHGTRSFCLCSRSPPQRRARTSPSPSAHDAVSTRCNDATPCRGRSSFFFTRPPNEPGTIAATTSASCTVFAAPDQHSLLTVRKPYTGTYEDPPFRPGPSK